MRSRIIKVLLVVLVLWIGFFSVDLITVTRFDHNPIFCIKKPEKSHFTGLGYSYDAYLHPITGEFEYCLYIFGQTAKSTFTD